MTPVAGQLTRLFAMQGLRIDESTAMYYLKESGGDLKKAVKLFGVFSSSPLTSPTLLCFSQSPTLLRCCEGVYQLNLFPADAESDKTWDHRA